MCGTSHISCNQAIVSSRSKALHLSNETGPVIKKNRASNLLWLINKLPERNMRIKNLVKPIFITCFFVASNWHIWVIIHTSIVYLALTSYLCTWYSSKVVTYCEYVLVNPAIITWMLLPNSPLLVSTVFTASRRRLPDIVVNSAWNKKVKIHPYHCMEWTKKYSAQKVTSTHGSARCDD